MRTLRQKVLQTCNTLSRKSTPAWDKGWMGVKSAYTSSESASKMRPLSQKVDPRDGIEPPSRTSLLSRVKRCICSTTRVFSCILQHVGSDPQAEMGRGEVNLSPIRVLTLRPRVGGFYVFGRLWEAQSIVLYVSGRFWEAHLYVFYVSGGGVRGSSF